MTRPMFALGVAVATLALAAGAQAHVTVEPAEGPSDGYATLEFSVPHGCEESPTTQLRVQIPENVPQVTPEVHPGWSLEVKEGPKEEVELHGETVTEGVSEVIWTATGDPLPPHFLDRFAMSVKLPAADEGEVVNFPAIQKCEQGETRWIQIPAEGESAEELDEPAPAVTLTAAEGEHGAPAEEAAAEPEDGDGLAIVALVVGGLGFLTGGVALTRDRRGA